MLEICLISWESEPQYAYKRYAYKKTCNSPLVSFKLTTQEITVIGMGMMESDMSYPSLRENGIIVEGIRYDFLRADDNMVWGRKQGEGTITMERSKQNVVICHTKEGDNLGNAKRVVEKVVDSFEYYGY